jgi:hypothetical protein
MALEGVLLAAPRSYAQVSCTREGLKSATELYIAAQTKGDISGLPLAMGLGYVENFKVTNISEGLIQKAMKIDHHRSLLDTATCQTFTEVIVANKDTPYVLGTRLRVNHALIAEIEILWTTTGYWGFNADNYLKYSSSEDWGPIPVARRDTRATLVSAASAYLDAFLEAKVDLTLGLPLQPHRRRNAHRQGSGGRFLPGRRAERRQYREPPLRRRRDDWSCGSLLHVRRRRRHGRQRSARYAPLPG